MNASTPTDALTPKDAATLAREPRLYALVPCAGVGVRACTAGPKQYVQLAERALVAHTLNALQRVKRLHAVLVMLAPDDAVFEREVPDFAGPGAWLSRLGGRTRAATVANGLQALQQLHGALDDDWVLVHDAARALIQPQWVDRLIDACLADPVGGLLAVPVADTLKAEESGRAASTVDRRGKWSAQTPQMFRLSVLRKALSQADDAVTDEASAVEALGLQPKLVMGDASNLKITWPEDFAHAQALLQAAAHTTEAAKTSPNESPREQPRSMASFRLGEGWDVHELVTGRPLVLGGVTVPHTHGLLAHSDGDALLHAVIDALLCAAGLGDIGWHFPDTDAAFAGVDSAGLLKEAAARVRAAGYAIVNVDSTIIAQAPRLAPHIDAMRGRIASVLEIDAQAVNVKAKTAEKLGPVGEYRAIEARAVCLLMYMG